MKVVISSVVLAACLSLVGAEVHLTNSNFDGIESGSTFEITWDDAQGPVTLKLKDGSEDNLQDVETITTGASGDSYSWSVDSLPTGEYAIEISDGSDVNYSKMFTIEGTADSSSSSSATPSASSSATSTDSSSSSETSEASSTSDSSSASSTSASSTTTSAESSSTEASSSVTPTTSSTSTPTQSMAAQTTVPNANDAQTIGASLVPGILALLGAALL
ncbi:Ser-Thr-rich glycosyl-phosphatidyl-inositol-anchored membrane family-domain-containing protein [Nemania sp. FL0916]|nr:Ser-Thr-rich glycosyl-phosphatidyl-inositol-anchored membrane family-domain-containing protein [Nemania sp. FL0916]